MERMRTTTPTAVVVAETIMEVETRMGAGEIEKAIRVSPETTTDSHILLLLQRLHLQGLDTR
jgi:hypothetical protein